MSLHENKKIDLNLAKEIGHTKITKQLVMGVIIMSIDPPKC